MSTAPRTPPAPKREWSLRSKAARGVLYQVIAIALIVLVAWFLAHNTLQNMRVRGIQSGFDFLVVIIGLFGVSEILLTIEEGTPFAALHASGKLVTPPDTQAAALYEITQELTEASGLPAYEISNHARSGGESRIASSAAVYNEVLR